MAPATPDSKIEPRPMLDFLKKLFTYDEWAIARSLGTIDPEVESKARLLLSHILLAEKIWLTRLNGEDSSLIPTFENYSIEKCRETAAELHQGYIELLDSLNDADLGELSPTRTQRAWNSRPRSAISSHTSGYTAFTTAARSPCSSARTAALPSIPTTSRLPGYEP